LIMRCAKAFIKNPELHMPKLKIHMNQILDAAERLDKLNEEYKIKSKANV
jgi:hypothetical protein